MRKLVTLFLLIFLLSFAACVTTGMIYVVYNEQGKPIFCAMLKDGDSITLLEGNQRRVAVKNGDWDSAFDRLGMTKEQCMALSNPVGKSKTEAE